jgi:TMEM175 potassium channel family protein
LTSSIPKLALSDAVFAIAMTLLVLSIGLPRVGPDETLGAALLDHDDELFSWLLSFVVLGVTWMRHRTLLGRVREVDSTLTWLNLAYLGCVAFLPYPTRVLGIYGGRPAAVALYAVTIALVSGIGGVMALHARRAGLLWPGDERAATDETWWIAPAILLLAISLSVLVRTWALLVWLLLIPLGRRYAPEPR